MTNEIDKAKVEAARNLIQSYRASGMNMDADFWENMLAAALPASRGAETGGLAGRLKLAKFESISYNVRQLLDEAISALAASPAPLPVEEQEPDFYALHSPTRSHIGLWPKKEDAYQVAKEYEGCEITPLYVSPCAAVPDEVRSFVYAILGADTWIEAGAIWNGSPEQRKAAHGFFGEPKP